MDQDESSAAVTRASSPPGSARSSVTDRQPAGLLTGELGFTRALLLCLVAVRGWRTCLMGLMLGCIRGRQGQRREAWVALLTSFNPDALRGRSNHSPVGSKPHSLTQPGNFSALGRALRGVLPASESWFCCAWSVSLGKVTSQSF